MVEDELPASKVEHAVLDEVAGPVLAPGSVGRIKVEGHCVLVRGHLMCWVVFIEENG